MWSVLLQPADGPPSDLSFAKGNKLKIGREADNDVNLAGWRVSRRHAELFVSNDQPFIRDLNSSAGTLVNGQRITTHGPLKPEDTIMIGSYSIQVRWAVAAAKPRVVQSVEAHGHGHGHGHRHGQSEAVAAKEPGDAAKPGNAANSAQAPTEDETFKWRRVLHERLLEAFDLRRVDVHKMSDSELRTRTEALISDLIEQMPEIPADADRAALLDAVRDEAIGLGLLEPLLADPSVTEVMVNRFDEVFI
jgi:pilus assembly protein CpaF